MQNMIVDYLFEGQVELTGVFFEGIDNIIIKGKRCSHMDILMLNLFDVKMLMSY